MRLAAWPAGASVTAAAAPAPACFAAAPAQRPRHGAVQRKTCGDARADAPVAVQGRHALQHTPRRVGLLLAELANVHTDQRRSFHDRQVAAQHHLVSAGFERGSPVRCPRSMARTAVGQRRWLLVCGSNATPTPWTTRRTIASSSSSSQSSRTRSCAARRKRSTCRPPNDARSWRTNGWLQRSSAQSPPCTCRGTSRRKGSSFL